MPGEPVTRGRRRTAAGALAAGLALLTVGALAGRGAGWVAEELDRTPFRHTVPLHETLSKKLAAFDAHRDEYTVLFLGTSRLYRDVLPSVFDAELAARGVRARSYNLSVSMMALPEAALLLEAVLARRPARLEWVILDERCVLFWDDNEETERHDYWHSLAETWRASGAILREPAPLARKLARLSTSWRAVLRNLLKTGRVIDRLYDPLTPRDDDTFGPDGYAPVDNPERRREFLAHLDQYRDRVAHLHDPPAPVDPYYAETIARIDALLRAHGARLALFSGPAPWRPQQLRGPDAPPAFRFDDPDADAALFDPALHADAGHLTDEGARLLTKELAARFAALAGAAPR